MVRHRRPGMCQEDTKMAGCTKLPSSPIGGTICPPSKLTKQLTLFSTLDNQKLPRLHSERTWREACRFQDRVELALTDLGLLIKDFCGMAEVIGFHDLSLNVIHCHRLNLLSNAHHHSPVK